MRKLFTLVFIFALIFVLTAGQAAAIDLQIGTMYVSPAQNPHGFRPANSDAFGVKLVIPFGASQKERLDVTLNGGDVSLFSEQDAKDSAIVIMLYGVYIGLAVLAASSTSN